MQPRWGVVHELETAHRYATVMGSSPFEVLVEVRPGVDVEDALPGDAQILQSLPSRLAIVTTDAEGVRVLEQSPEINAVYPEEVPQEALNRFDQVSRAFAAGWNERRRPKERRGEGLSWDSPGFDPP
jgi:hypothetical protein